MFRKSMKGYGVDVHAAALHTDSPQRAAPAALTPLSRGREGVLWRRWGAGAQRQR